MLFRSANGANPVSDASIKNAAEHLNAPFNRAAGENPYTLHAELQQTTNDLVGIIRIKNELEESLKKIAELRNRLNNVKVEGGRSFNPGFHLAFDLDNMLLVAESTAKNPDHSRGRSAPGSALKARTRTTCHWWPNVFIAPSSNRTRPPKG